MRFEFLRGWLERALQLTDRPFESAREASDALAEMHSERREEDGFDASLRLAPPVVQRQEIRPPAPALVLESENPSLVTDVVPVAPVRKPMSRTLRWVAVAAGVLALAEAAFIGRMLYLDASTQTAAVPASAIPPPPPGPEVVSSPDALSAQVTAVPVNAEPEVPAIRVLPAVASVKADTVVRDVRVPPVSPSLPAPAAARSGGFRVSSPIELHVLDGERVLGTSGDGPIITRAGRHQFDFVNSVIGYRVRREVDVKPGQIAAVSIAVPNGTLNVNATPWATVFIDGTPYGETPLGNLSIVPGEHEIVFRHPQLGERRERVIVRPDVPSRVAVNWQR